MEAIMREPSPPGISEEEIARDGPMVRALVVRRLELMWRVCEPRIDVAPDERVDPRFLETGVRVLDRLTRLYRLDHEGSGDNASIAGAKPEYRALVSRGVQELEQRMRESEDHGKAS